MQLFFGLTLLIINVGRVYGQNTTSTTASDLVSALTDLELAGAAGAIDLVAKLPEFQPFFDELGAGNKTFFVPTNFSLSEVETFGSDIPNALRTLDYHVARGQLSASTAPAPPNHDIASSLLTDNSTVFLNGDAQWLVVTKEDDGNLHILNQPTDAVVHKSQTVSSLNVVINLIDNFLVLPGNLSATLTARNMTQFQASLQKAGLLDSLASERGITIFAPTDSAFGSASSALKGADNATLATILRNHVMNTTVYSPNLGAEQFSITGQTLRLSNGSVSAGSSTAKLSQTDVGLQNGVMHVIDTVLMDKDTGPSSGANKVAKSEMSSIVILMFAVVALFFMN